MPIIDEVVARYEDSHQPTGETRFDPFPHMKMKKLVHELHLIVDGPDQTKALNCVDQAKAAGLIAGLGAAFLGAGLGATEVAWKAASTALAACLGGSFSARLDNRSWWEEWWT